MFKSKEKRYLTKGVDLDVPKEVQMFCWQLIDGIVKEEISTIDYLQIFEFKKDLEEKTLIVIHKQEEPSYQKSSVLKLEGNLLKFEVSKLWVIDDGENQTMLLPEEY